MIHLNTRGAKKSFQKTQGFSLSNRFFSEVLCLTETLFDDGNSESLLYQLTQYTAIHQHRSTSQKSDQGWEWGWG